MPEQENLDQKVKAVKVLLNAFRLERMLYVIISCISVVVLLGTVLYSFGNSGGQDKTNLTVIASLFAPAGAITYSIGKILKMWNEALRFISNEKNSGGDGK